MQTTCGSSSTSKRTTHGTKLRNKISNLLLMRHRPVPASAPPKDLPIKPEPAINLIRGTRSSRLSKSTLTRSCRSSSTCNSIHPVKLGKSFSMNQRSIPLPLPPFQSTSLPEPESLFINFSDLKRETPIRREAGGTVYIARHMPTGRLYAVKVIDCIGLNVTVRRQIIREFQVLRDVANPNIVKCHDTFEINDEIHVLLEYMDGGSLKDKHISNEKTLSDLARQILTGLAFLHRRRVAHRDIKPSNLLVNSRREIKMADFAGRVIANTMDPCYSSFGNMAYMCPERINTDLNHGRFNPYAGDIWSLGVSILEFYMGRFPFNAHRAQEDWASLMWTICMSQPPEAPSTASGEFQNFIASCLQRDPDKRMSAAQLLRHPFISGDGSGRCS